MHEIQEVCDGFQRIIDLVRNTSRKAPRNSQLLGAPQCLLRKVRLLHLISNLILALSPSKSSFKTAQQGFWASRALK
jgi:hypothetical protein